ncbi:MAG: VanW family protein [Clostridia bacterium]|nr:VanW family protein [Clostridia bacterium]
MKKLFSVKLNALILMPALVAGIIFIFCGFAKKLPSDITVNGIAVGGKTQAQAVALVRESIETELKTKTLTIVGKKKNYVFTYPEIGYKDDLQKLIKTVKKHGEYTAQVTYYLNGINDIASAICEDESSPAVEPYAIFNNYGTPFTYVGGSDGICADKAKLLNDIKASLEGGFEKVIVKTSTVKRKTDMKSVLEDTKKLSSYITYFDGENESRSHNIRLAADKINGTILQSGESFSFNATVGERTEARGFKTAKIIEKGYFVEGVGGGVCQVSTTLFNAAISGGLRINEYHPHSLSVSYVPPSCDAMVSGTYFDLKFENVTGYTVYIRARTGKNYVAFDLYGRGDGAKYSLSSTVTGSIPAPEETTDDETQVKAGRDGILSEGYLTVTRNGITKTTLFRKDKYSPVKRVVLNSELQENATNDETHDGEEATA